MTPKTFIAEYTQFIQLALSLDEIMTNRITHEKDKRTRLYKTIQKRAVIGIQAGDPPYILHHILNSLTGLPYHEDAKLRTALSGLDEKR